MLSEEFKENWAIFSSSLSYYYLFCVFISFVAVFVACFCQKSVNQPENIRDKEDFSIDCVENSDQHRSTDSLAESGSDRRAVTDVVSCSTSAQGHSAANTGSTTPGSLASIPSSCMDNEWSVANPSQESAVSSSTNSGLASEREVLIEQIASQLTPDEIINEKQVERQQLEEIFKLVNCQKDLFKIDSIQDLEDQLKLYR